MVHEANTVPKGTIQITLTITAQYLVLWLFYIIVTKTGTLTQTDLGVLSILLFLASLFSTFTKLELPTALTKFASENLGKKQAKEAAAIRKTTIRTVLILSLAGFAIATFFSGWLSKYFWNTPSYAPLIILTFGFAFLSNLRILYDSSLQALRLFGKMAAVILTFIVFSRFIAIALVLLHFGVSGVLIGYIAGSLVALAAATVFTRGKFPKPDNNNPLRPLLHFSFPLFLSSIILLILSQVDIVIIASMTSNYALVGIYYMTIQSLVITEIIWNPLRLTLFPVLSARYSLHDPEGISNIVNTASRYLSYTMFPCCLGLAAIAPTALTLFYGSSYATGAMLLTLLSIATIILAFYSLFTTTLTAIAKTKEVLKINAVLAFSLIVMLVVLVPFLGAVGAALSRLIIYAIGFTLAVYLLLKEDIKVQLNKEAILKSATASIIIMSFLIALEWRVSTKIPAIQMLAMEILTAVSIYFSSLYVLKALNNQDFELIRQAFPKSLAKHLDFLERIFVR